MPCAEVIVDASDSESTINFLMYRLYFPTALFSNFRNVVFFFHRYDSKSLTYFTFFVQIRPIVEWARQKWHLIKCFGPKSF